MLEVTVEVWDAVTIKVKSNIYGDSDTVPFHIYSSCGFRRHLVGKTLRQFFYCDIVKRRHRLSLGR